jgi:hypothetical protein
MMTQQEIIPPTTVAKYDDFRSQLTELKSQNEKTVFEYETPTGYKAARSYIATLRTTKSAIEKRRKELKDESLQTGRQIDAIAKDLTSEVEAMINVHMLPIQQIDDRETARVAAIKARLDGMAAMNGMSGISSAQATHNINRLKAAKLDDETYAEYIDQALTLHAAALSFQENELQVAIKRETEQAELERLRAIEAERLQKERETQIANDAAAKATAEAEAKTAVAVETAKATERNRFARTTKTIMTDAERMRSALQYYADGNWDGGTKAQEALTTVGDEVAA